MNRNSFILVGLLVVLVGAAYLLMQKQGEQDRSVDSAQHFVTIDSASVDGISIQSPTNSLMLEKQSDTWYIKEPLVYKANNASVTNLIHQIIDLRVKSIASSNADKHSLFKVDSTGSLVTFFEKGKELAAFYVGKSGQSYNDTYVRKKNSDDVVLVNALLTYTMDRQVKEWRDKTIYTKPKESINEVSFQYGDTTFTLVSSDHGWTIGKDSVKENTATSLISALSNFTADDFLDSSNAATKKIQAVVTIGEDQIRFAFDKNANKYYVQTSTAPQWFVIEPWKANQILKRKKDLV